jgi:transposase
MLMLPENIRIFLRRDPTDMRLGYNGLSALAGSVFREKPTSGHLFVFVNRQRNRAKMVYWERGGFRLLSRRLKQGTFALPDSDPDGALSVDRVLLAIFLDGVVAERIRRKKRYSPPWLNRLH